MRVLLAALYARVGRGALLGLLVLGCLLYLRDMHSGFLLGFLALGCLL